MNKRTNNNSNVAKFHSLNGVNITVRYDGIDSYLVQTSGGAYNSKFYIHRSEGLDIFGKEIGCYYSSMNILRGILKKVIIEENNCVYHGSDGLRTQPMNRKELVKNVPVDIVMSNTTLVQIVAHTKTCTNPFDPDFIENHAHIELVFSNEESLKIKDFFKRTK